MPLVWAALLATTFPWSITPPVTDVDNGNLVVDVVKLAILCGTVAVAVQIRKPPPFPLVIKLMLGYASVALLAAALPSLSVDGVLRAVRLWIVVVGVCWIAQCLSLREILRGISGVAAVLGGMALLGEVTGLGVGGERLYGFLPYLHPNTLALIVGIGVVATVALWVKQDLVTLAALSATAVLTAALVLTGSRTALATTILGTLIVLGVAFARRVGRVLILAWLGAALLVGLGWVAALTKVDPVAYVVDLFARGGKTPFDPTLTGRTAAWDIVLNTRQDWIRDVVGHGLQYKTVPRQVGDEVLAQGIDNTWISASAAAGWLGLALLIAAAVVMLGRTVLHRSAPAAALVIVVLAGSWTESSLADISFPLAVVLACTVAVDRHDPRITAPTARHTQPRR